MVNLSRICQAVFAVVAIAGCVDTAESTQSDTCVSNVSTHETSCFGNFTNAVEFVTNGLVTDAPVSASQAFNEGDLAARIEAAAGARSATPTPGSSFLLSIHYQHESFNTNRSGLTWMWTGSQACDNDPSTLDFWIEGYGNNGENDQVSSFITFSNCQEILYEATFWGGASTSLATSYSNLSLSNMNDKASSSRWF